MYFQNAYDDVYRTVMQKSRVYRILIKIAVKKQAFLSQIYTSAFHVFTYCEIQYKQ